MLTTVAPLGSNIDGTGESPRSARVADQNGPISKTLIFAPNQSCEAPVWVDAVEKGKNEPIEFFRCTPAETGFS